MNTIIYKINKGKIDDKYIKKAGEYLKEGKLVSFPTETVYGLGADGLNERAVSNIYKAKGRPSDNPLILHVSKKEDVEKLVENISDIARICIDKFWPGPLTLIFKKSTLIPNIITGGLDTVAIRMPSNEIANKIIEAANTPIAAPSANTSGRPSPTSARHVEEDLLGKVDMIIDGGICDIGLESTVLDTTGKYPVILRPGKITKEELESFFPKVLEDKSILNPKEAPKSPGQKYTHYSPKAKMYLFLGSDEKVARSINKKLTKFKDKKVGILGTDENKDRYNLDGVMFISLGKKKDYDSIAKNLFKSLRKFDSENIEFILSEGFEDSELGNAIMNRMVKASGGNIIYVNEVMED